jgi:hypothetical protein
MPVSKIGYINGQSTEDSLIKTVRYLFPLAEKFVGYDSRGGYLTIIDLGLGAVLGTARIGAPPPKKSKKYFRFSAEKALRLLRYPKHNTSRQSRDIKRNKFGGAVRGSQFIVSFSGLPEIWDEALVISVLVIEREVSFSKALKITTTRVRKAFKALYAAYLRDKTKKK